MKSSPTDTELHDRITETLTAVISLTSLTLKSAKLKISSFFLYTLQIENIESRLSPLRSGVPLISAAELAQIDSDWGRWRSEWVRRKKIFMTYAPRHILRFP